MPSSEFNNLAAIFALLGDTSGQSSRDTQEMHDTAEGMKRMLVESAPRLKARPDILNRMLEVSLGTRLALGSDAQSPELLQAAVEAVIQTLIQADVPWAVEFYEIIKKQTGQSG